MQSCQPGKNTNKRFIYLWTDHHLRAHGPTSWYGQKPRWPFFTSAGLHPSTGCGNLHPTKKHNPIGSMGLVYLPTVHESLMFMVNVGRYTIDGCYGNFFWTLKSWTFCLPFGETHMIQPGVTPVLRVITAAGNGLKTTPMLAKAVDPQLNFDLYFLHKVESSFLCHI